MAFFLSCLALCSLLHFMATPALGDPIADFVQATMKERSIPGLSLAVVQDGKTLREEAFGVVSLELGVAATAQSVFPVASVTKIFTATLVMRLVQDGKLGIDAKVGDLLPDLPETWRAVTLRQLLTHTSGLPDMIVDPMKGLWLGETREEALAKAAPLPLQFEAGTAWSYNQTNYILLGMILERVSGKSLEALLQESILGPLQMKSTTYADARQVVAGRGPWYSRIDFSGTQPRLATKVYPTWVTYPDFVHTCAGLNTTALELARFVDRVAAGKVLAPATLANMWQRQTLRDGKPAGMDETTGMGLGWILEEHGGSPWVGATGGATVALRHAVREKLTVVVLTNCQGSDPDGIATEILSRLLGTQAK